MSATDRVRLQDAPDRWLRPGERAGRLTTHIGVDRIAVVPRSAKRWILMATSPPC
jgi:hypothetical protein